MSPSAFLAYPLGLPIITMYTVLGWLLLTIPVLINVAFITLIERKILGYSQLRLGPNKVGLGGIIQPFADAVKLFTNQIEAPSGAHRALFLLAPMLSLRLIITIWSLTPFKASYWVPQFSRIILLILLSVGVYPLLLSGWASTRKYALIGAIRGVAQTISYEVRLALVFIRLLRVIGGISLEGAVLRNQYTLSLALAPWLLVLWLVSLLAETNRTPFDFSEGESELVSGFNVEYASGGFALLFIAEYARIYFLSTLTVYFLVIGTCGPLRARLLSSGLVFVWVWVRATYPRYRYDLLIGLAWCSILPATLALVLWATACALLLA